MKGHEPKGSTPKNDKCQSSNDKLVDSAQPNKSGNYIVVFHPSKNSTYFNPLSKILTATAKRPIDIVIIIPINHLLNPPMR